MTALKIRIATRKSALALWQAEHVAERLAALPGVTSTELLPMSTRGDEILDRSLQKIGGKGLFIKELEVAMQNGAADLAVHSMKDVPADMPAGFCLAAILERANHADALVSKDKLQIDELPAGARIGSSSLRRQAQLKMMRPDIQVEPLRGNVNTRLAKLESGEFDAIILAAAGLERLGLEHHISQQFSPQEMLPAAAQGVLGIECLEGNTALRTLLEQLSDETALQTTTAERTIARVLQANCQSPVAAHATIDAGSLHLSALVAHPDGTSSISASDSGPVSAAAEIGAALAESLLQQGARELLDSIEAVHD
ncbi:MAG: hydroxymethylbilane synthase [Gammaproteobacteria bacterium]|nr:hydroxymethylbilane synthase [Gammaproteobacteria bacterium]